MRHPKHLGHRRDARRYLATAARLVVLLAGFDAVCLSMPLGLIEGRPFKPFSRAISSYCDATTTFSSDTALNSPTNRASSSARDRSDKSQARIESYSPASGQA
jgi:hypothetical protein